MGRNPCCDKSGLKKGPWTTEEDVILTVFINQNGHGNWRALPKRAGLMRCGKSCRLRWMNYLRPDIKRGNFTTEEEEMIIKLHQELGNKWSVIAARLPGRTDNEIKNVWNTHLKKKKQLNVKSQSYSNFDRKEEMSPEPTSTTQSFSEASSVSTAVDGGSNVMPESPLENLMEMSESFWSEVFSGEDWSGISDFSSGDSASDFDKKVGNDFWENVFCKPELFQF
ncbi:hypothetical protein ACS0TY_013032 [Phlomoides rotata]